MVDEQELLSGMHYCNGTTEISPVEIEIFLNKSGLIGMTFGGSWIEVSPLVARRMIDRFRVAVSEALSELQSEVSAD